MGLLLSTHERHVVRNLAVFLFVPLMSIATPSAKEIEFREIGPSVDWSMGGGNCEDSSSKCFEIADVSFSTEKLDNAIQSMCSVTYDFTRYSLRGLVEIARCREPHLVCPQIGDALDKSPEARRYENPIAKRAYCRMVSGYTDWKLNDREICRRIEREAKIEECQSSGEQSFPWGSLAFVGFFVLGLIGYLSVKKKCAYCGSRKLKFENSNPGNFFWTYRNKDGSRDKRVKNNVEKAFFYSTYACKDCKALTKFEHSPAKKPSINQGVVRRTLIKNGDGERKGTNWECAEATPISTSGENRKGKQ